MGPVRFLTLLAAGLLSVATAAPAFAAPVGAATPATSRAEIAYPAQVRRLQDLNFGYLSVTTAGTAVMNPNTDALTTTGGVVALGRISLCRSFRSGFTAKGRRHRPPSKEPDHADARRRDRDDDGFQLDDLGGGNSRNVAAQEAFSFAIGGTLTVNANQAEGAYQGTFDVEVQYP